MVCVRGSPMGGSSWVGYCMWWSGIYVFLSAFMVMLCVYGVSCVRCCVFCFLEFFGTSSCASSSVPPALYDLL